jgi:IS4 transposase
MRARKGFVREHALRGGREGWVLLGKDGPRVRAVQIALKSGEIETLITNLGEEELDYEGCAEFYHRRWGIETTYKTVKQKLELENFSGRLADNIKQDFAD